MRLTDKDAIIYILSEWKRVAELKEARWKKQNTKRAVKRRSKRDEIELNRLQIIEQNRRKDLVTHMNLLKEI